MSSDVTIRGGYLRFNSIRKSDKGNYICIARNSVGEIDMELPIYIQNSDPITTVQEIVEISPERYDGNIGDDIRLVCSCRPQGRITWTKWVFF